MSYNYKHNDRRCCRHYQRTPETIGISSEYDADSSYTCETIKNRSGDHNITHKSKNFNKESRFPESNNEIGINKYHNTKCPVYVHNMKMQKHYSQNDAYQNPKHHRHQPQVYSCNKWDYYNDRTHYMKNKFDKLTLNNEYAQKHQKSDCGKTSCPVHHACNTELKSAKRSIPKTETKVFNEDVINKLEESYWTKWKPKCKAHDRKANDGEKMIRTEDDYMKCKCKANCESERNLPLRCPDCFKCVPNDNDVKCLHKRAATKESKSSDFVKSELDSNESSPIEANYNTERNESYVNVCCDCPKSCPGKVEMSSSGQCYQKMIETDWNQSGVEQSNNNKFQVKARTCSSVMPTKQKRIDKHAAYATDKEDEHKMDKEGNKIEKSGMQECDIQTCPYVLAAKQKKLDKNAAYLTDKEDESEIDKAGKKREKSRTQECEVQTCPYVVADKQKKLDKNAAYLTDKEDESEIDKAGNKREKSRTQECEIQTCPYVVAAKQKKLDKNAAYLTDKGDESEIDKAGNKRETSRTQECEIPSCPYVVAAKQKKLDKNAAYLTDKGDESEIDKAGNKRETSRTQECEIPSCPYVVAAKQKKLDKNAAYLTDKGDESEIDKAGNKRETSRTQECEIPSCPYVVAAKQKKLDKNAAYLTDKGDESEIDKAGNKRETSRTQECEIPTCPYVVADKQKKLDKNATYLTDKEDESEIDKAGNKREKSRTQECEIPSCPYVVAANQKKLDKNIPKTKDNINVYEVHTKVEKSLPLKSELPTCPYVTKRKLNQKTSESDTSGSCNNPRCYKFNTKYETNVSLEGQDVEEQLKITQYSNRLLAKSVQNRGVNAEETIKNERYDKIVGSDDPIQQFSNNAIGDSRHPDKAKPASNQNTTAESSMIPSTPEGAEFPLTLKHTDSFILNSIKQNNSEGKPHYKQPTTIKLSNTARVKGHSYPLKPILKKEKQQTQRKALLSPKKPAAKSLKPTIKKRN